MSEKSHSPSKSTSSEDLGFVKFPPRKITEAMIITYYKNLIADYDFFFEFEKVRTDNIYNAIQLKEVLCAFIYIYDIQQTNTKEINILSNILARLENPNNPPMKGQIMYFIYYLSNLDVEKTRSSSLDNVAHMYS